MERQEKIVDASVVFKWFSNEEDSDKSLLLKEKLINEEISLIIPDLLFLEISNALKYKKEDSEKIKRANKDLWEINLIVKRLNESIIEKAIEIALKYNFTIYDSLYVALSQIYGCELITADEKLIKAPNVRLLNEI